MLPDKYIITDKKKTGDLRYPYGYTLVFVGQSNCQQTHVMRSDLDIPVGNLVTIDKFGIKPWEILYTNEQIKNSYAQMVICYNYQKNNSIKITLFDLDYGIIAAIVQNPLACTELTRGHIVSGAKWGDIFYITKNLSTNTTYIKNDNIMVTHDMVVLDATLAGDYYNKPSYKHLFVHSGRYFSVMVPATDKLFSVQENDELLIWDDQQNDVFDVLDNNTINKLMTDHVLRQRQK